MSGADDSVKVILERMRVPGEQGMFVLGCFERPATVYMQQVRALNLIYALNESSDTDEKSLVIVGGGFAGITAAAAAAILGWRVTVLEAYSNNVLSLAGADSSIRMLHPHIYDWPREGSERHSSDLGVLDWHAAPAEQVVERLREQWSVIEKAYAVETHLGVSNTTVHPIDQGYLLHWNGYGAKSHERSPVKRIFTKQADSVIFAVGFGKEEPTWAFTMVKSYWQRDDLYLDSIGTTQPGLALVSGTGDGGLIDALRLSFDDFKHESVLEKLRTEWLGVDAFAAVKERLAVIESLARDARSAGVAYEAMLNWNYRRLVDSLVLKSPVAFRNDVVVILTGTSEFPLTLESAPVNRFLFALTRAQYIPGPVLKVREEGENWKVTFRDQTQAELTVQTVVVRHGPVPSLKKYFPKVYGQCRSLIEAARTTGRDPTRDRHYDDEFYRMLKHASQQLGLVMSPDENTIDGAFNSSALANYRKTINTYLAALVSRFDRLPEPAGSAQLLRLKRRSTGYVSTLEDFGVSWLQWFYKSSVIIGDPSAERTWLMRHLLGKAARDPQHVPIYLDSQQVRGMLDGSFFSQAIHGCVASLTDSESERVLWSTALHKVLAQRRLLVIVEGIDQLPSDTGRQLAGLINQDRKAVQEGCRLIMTSREGHFYHRLDEIEILEMAPLPLPCILEGLGQWAAQGTRMNARTWALANFIHFKLRGQFGPLVDTLKVRGLPEHTEQMYQCMDWWLSQVQAMDAAARCALGELALTAVLDSRDVFSKDEVFRCVVERGPSTLNVDLLLSMAVLRKQTETGSEMIFSHWWVQEILAAEALARRVDTHTLVSMFLDGVLPLCDVVPIALGREGHGTTLLTLLEGLPESVDYKILWLRLKVLWYQADRSPQQTQRLADDVYKVVCVAGSCGDDILCRLGSACAGLPYSVAEEIASRLAAALKSSDSVVQHRLLRFCARACFNKSALFISPLLLSGNETVRQSAAETLGQLGDVAVIPELIEHYLSGSSFNVPANALEAVTSLGGEAARLALESILLDKTLYQNLRWPAATQLGILGNPRAFESLRTACSDEAVIVRSESVRALGRLDNPAVVSVLSGCMNDPEPTVRYAAIEALVGHAGPYAMDTLLRIISDRSEAPDVRNVATRAMLGREPEQLLKSIRRVLKRSSDEWRSEAVRLLPAIHFDGAKASLLPLSHSHDSALRQGVAKALQYQFGEDVTARLIELLDDASASVRNAAMDSLANKSGSAVVNALARCLVAESPHGSVPAAQALSRIGDPAGLDAIRHAVQGGFSFHFMTFFKHVSRDEDVPLLVTAWRNLPPMEPLNPLPDLTQAIGRTGGAKAAAVLRQLFDRAEVKARLSVVLGLAEVEDPAAIPALLLALIDEDESVQRRARWILQEKSDALLREGLTLALWGDTPAVQQRAAELCPYYADEAMMKAISNVDSASWKGDKPLDEILAAMRYRMGFRFAAASVKR